MKSTETLDVGCGHVFGHHKRGLIGIDLKRGKADMIGDANCLPIKDNAFDKVHARSLLYLPFIKTY